MSETNYKDSYGLAKLTVKALVDLKKTLCDTPSEPFWGIKKHE